MGTVMRYKSLNFSSETDYISVMKACVVAVITELGDMLLVRPTSRAGSHRASGTAVISPKLCKIQP